jgi:RNA polymerase sigma-54 factor
MESWEVVRQKLLHVIENEDKSDPLSDEQLAAELGKQGIDIARRTVSKYRKILEIPSSRQRKEY